MLHVAKGDIVGFTHDKEIEIEMTNTLEVEEVELRAPRNWIPERSWRNYKKSSKISQKQAEISETTNNSIRTSKILQKSTWKQILSTNPV